MRAAIDAAPHLADEALAWGLIDGQLFRDQAILVAARLGQVTKKAMAAGGQQATASLRGMELQRVLAQLDGEPTPGGVRLPHIGVARYAAALEAQRRWQRAVQRWERRLGQVMSWPLQLFSGSDSGNGSGYGYGGTISQGAAGAVPAPPATRAGAAGHAQPPVVALLTLTGPVYLGTGPSSPIPMGPAAAKTPTERIASLPVIRSLRALGRDPAVRAVVLRIDSPGEWIAMVCAETGTVIDLLVLQPSSACIMGV